MDINFRIWGPITLTVNPIATARPIDYLDVGDYLSDGYASSAWSLVNMVIPMAIAKTVNGL